MNQIDDAAHKLIESLYTTESVKKVALTLENLSSNPAFKKHTYEIAVDENLSAGQKAHQLANFLTRVEIPELVNFLNQLFENGELWLFDSQAFDHFDEFSKNFQLAVDQATVVHLVTAIELPQSELKQLGVYFSQILNKHALLNHHVNSDMGGGAQVRIENLIFDYSLKARLKRFEKKWVDSLVSTSQLMSAT